MQQQKDFDTTCCGNSGRSSLRAQVLLCNNTGAAISTVTAAPSLLGSAYGPPRYMRIDTDEVGSLPAGVESPANFTGRWLVVETRGQFERRIAAVLLAAGAGYFLPMERLYKKNGGGNRCLVNRILFPGYLFACCRHEDDCYELSNRDGVKRIIRVSHQQQLIRELAAISIAMSAGLLSDQRPELGPGVKCEIVRGPLKGCQGWIDARDDKKGTVVLKVTVLGQSCPTNISIEDVEAI